MPEKQRFEDLPRTRIEIPNTIDTVEGDDLSPSGTMHIDILMSALLLSPAIV